MVKVEESCSMKMWNTTKRFWEEVSEDFGKSVTGVVGPGFAISCVPRGERFASHSDGFAVFRVLLSESKPETFFHPKELPRIHIIVDYGCAFKYVMKAARKLEKRGYEVTVKKDWDPFKRDAPKRGITDPRIMVTENRAP